jgi:hypothetical protein
MIYPGIVAFIKVGFVVLFWRLERNSISLAVKEGGSNNNCESGFRRMEFN